MSQKSVEKRFGQSPVFIAATFMEQGGIPPTTNPATLLKEAIHVISCGYEDKTEWGKEVCFQMQLQSLLFSFLPV